jgi:uncharacterized Zn finger protein
MKVVELERKSPGNHLVCSICGNGLFDAEVVSKEKVRLTCENCGQCHLIIFAEAEDKNQFLVKFRCEEKSRLDLTQLY